MSYALELTKAILGGPGADDSVARDVLEAALVQEVDVLQYCAATLGMGYSAVMARAANWAGYQFVDRIPLGEARDFAPTRLEALADVRMFRVRVEERDIAYVAPGFLDLLRLKRQIADNPALVDLVALVPEPALRAYLTNMAATALVDDARQNLSRRWPYASAHLELTKPARYGFAMALILLLGLVLLAPYFAQAWILPLVIGLLVVPALIRLAAVAAPVAPASEPVRPENAELPVYSVLVPLRNEAAMVPQLFAALGALDYPPERLDIKFVVEARSPRTVQAVRQRLGDPRFSLVEVPDAAPRTKPKALDFALPLCRGEHVVVFDAEDIPAPDQLWKAALRFRDEPDIVCLQARLVIENGRKNWLTALFTAEYAGLFTVLLPALARWRMPMPLGGTSNHFRIAALRELGGWDAYNVTEDADLGMRLARRRLRVEMLASHTVEAAPVRLRPWLGQRSRWMKGWMQTFIVHNRDPGRLCAQMGLPAFLMFQSLVLGMILSPVLHCCFAVTLAVKWLTGHGGLQGPWGYLYLGVMALGYGSALALSATGLARLNKQHLLVQQVLLPVYWLLMGAATIRAVHELVVKPYYWFKSPHAPMTREAVAPAEAATAAPAAAE